MKFRSRLKPEMGIPMVSMADIAFLLIIFFTLTSSFARVQGLKVDLATAKHLERLPEMDIKVTITDKGTVAINDRIVPAGRVEAELATIFGMTRTRTVTVLAHQASPYGTVFEVLSVVRKLGGSISLAGKREAPAETGLSPGG